MGVYVSILLIYCVLSARPELRHFLFSLPEVGNGQALHGPFMEPVQGLIRSSRMSHTPAAVPSVPLPFPHSGQQTKSVAAGYRLFRRRCPFLYRPVLYIPGMCSPCGEVPEHEKGVPGARKHQNHPPEHEKGLPGARGPRIRRAVGLGTGGRKGITFYP